MNRTRFISVFVAILVMISAFAMLGSTQAYAAGLAKASVTLSNTSATSVKISWSKVSKAKKYTVYRSTSKSSGFKAIKTTTSRSLTSTGLTCGKTYYFKVKAINGGKSSTSSVKSIKVKPVKPTLKVSKGCTFINLSWSKDKNATGYEIYSSSSKNGKYKKLATVKDASYKNSGLKFSTSRYYKVRAYKTVKGKKIYGSYSSVGGAKTVSAHNPSTSWKITKKATCNATGTKTNVCSYCKKTITEVIPKSDEHVWSSSKINASNKYCAYTRKTCKVCKKSYDLDKNEHKYSSVVKSATCTAEGYTTYTCTRETCRESYKDNFVSAIGHKEVVDSAIEPTCTETGLSQGKHCSVCNEIIENQEIVDALGHNEEIIQDNVKDSTCITEGSYYSVTYCSRCDIELRREKNTIEKKPHSFGEWNVTKEPSCVDGEKVKCCSYCGLVDAETISAIYEHIVVTDEAVAPTCEEAGFTEGSHCERCNQILIKQEIIPANGHDFETEPYYNLPTCTEPGILGRRCKVCELIFEKEEIPALGHNIVVDSAVEPTCTETGLTEGSHCSVCNEIFVAQDVIEALGHTIVIDEAVEPTCTTTGLTEGKHCSVCNEVIENQEIVDAFGHNEEIRQDNVIDSTCIKEGSYYQVTYCSRCDIELRREKKTIDKKPHSFGEWNVTKEPSCVDGEKVKCCSYCGLVDAEPISAIYEHIVVIDEAVAPTCEEAGFTEGSHCERCNQILIKQEIIPANGHDFETEPYDNPPTCTEPGILGRRCKVCKLIFDREEVPALGHNIVVDSAIEPTCTTTGLTEGSHCSVCNEIFVAQDVIEALGHTIVIDEAVEPTCTTTGLTEGKHCSVCNEVLVEQNVVALGHEYNAVVTAPTCTEQGYTTYTCERCDDSYIDNYVDALGHTVVTDEAVASTCEEAGLTEGSHCERCNQILIKQEIIPANGHDFETVPYNLPTCTEPGILGRRCKVCELIFDRYEVPALGHNIVVDSAVEPTCTETGLTEGSHCARCGEIYVAQEVISSLGHNQVVDLAIEPTCTETGLTEGSHCERCGEIFVEQEVISAGHSISTRQDNFVDSTCFTEGSYYSVTYCSRCDDMLSSQRVVIEKKKHAYDKCEITDEGYRKYYCENCNEIGSIDYTCYIDLTTQTVSVPGVAEFGMSTGSTVINKLDLTPDGISNFEITGSAKDITIDVNADRDVEIKLNGVTIENQTADCFDIKNKSTDVDELGEPIVPWVSISAKDGTVNTLKTVSGGNAIETSCKLELKGRGKLNMNTSSTSINSKAKIEIKNLTLNITSKNRGIDTKNDVLNDIGMIVSTDYSNIEIKPNAKITINSTDDGIRCKNMTITALDETVGDVNSVINITAGSDGIQLEGKTGIDVYSGDITINAGKYAFNCSSDRIKFNNGVSSAKCKGTVGFSK